MDRKQAETLAGAIRSAQGELATKGDIERLETRLGALQWVVGIQCAITLATFAAVLWVAARMLA